MSGPADDQKPADLVPSPWHAFGQRNILFIGFVTLLVPLGMALDGRRPTGTQGQGGFAFALTLCVAVSAAFFLINAGFVVADLARGRATAKAVIGCLLPLVFGITALVAARLTF